MKAGDLVKVGYRCKGAGRLAIVLGKKFQASKLYQIRYCDTGATIEAHKSNLEFVSESR